LRDFIVVGYPTLPSPRGVSRLSLLFIDIYENSSF
jgi:hypothetical protein